MITNVDPIVPYQAMFAALDPDLPLALLPIRMETLFTPARHPDTLTVRFHPDVIHADAHAPELSAAEIDLGRAFWQRTWRAGPDPAAAQSAFDWLAGQVGPWRAAWVARQLTPKNQEVAPRRPVAEGLPLVPPPDFPKLGARTAPAVPTARLLPLRFVVVARNELHVEGTWFGAPVPEDLAMALSLSDADASDVTALLRGQGLDWTHDVDAAVAVGMALRIDLTPAQARHGFDALVAFGIRAGDESQALNALLEAHRYTNGLDLIPVGEPTNVTDVARPTVHPAHPDLAALRTSELLAGDTAARPAIDADGDLYRAGASDALGLGLGLAAGSALDRAEHAVAQHPAWAEGMNRVLWPALIGHYLDQVMDTVVDAEGRAWLRGFSASFARGGGVLPPLLIGTQPYGVLPVSFIAEEESEPGTNVQQVEQVIATLIDVWRQSLASVAVLDADATDQAPEGTEGDLAATVSKVLGHLPNPAGLRVRPVEEMRAEYVDSYAGRMGGLKLLCLFLPDPQGNPYDPEDNPAVIRFEELEAELARGYLFQLSAFVDAAEMYASLSVDHGVVLTPAQLERYDEIAAYIREKLVPLVEAHRARTAPAISVFPFDQIPREHLDLGDPEAPEAFYSFHGAEGTEQDWALDLVAGDHSADAVAEVRSWLAELLDLASAGDPGPTETGPLPLLRRLAVISLDRAVGTDDLPDVVAGLRTLVELTDVAPDPVAELERLLREAIGVSSYRLDAWHTAVAAWRLENRRSKRPRGLQLGAYGLLTDVRPRAARSSQGFIAAPSIAQATTGAVVRAGWSALGGAEEAAALAVNLASERVRRGRWLIEGVRRGQDLRLLLGSRCERRLVEAGLPVWVEPLRGVALGAVGSSAAPTAIMDGLLVARAASDASDLDEIETECARLLAELLADPDRPPGDPSAVLTDLTADLDAVADLVTAQSVHDVTRGRTARATANLTAAAGGEVDLPAVTVPDTPREAVTITHQLILALPDSGTGPWPGPLRSGRALAAPAVERWVQSQLGAPSEVTVAVNPGGFTITLADLGIGALDLLDLLPPGDDPGLGRLETLIRAAAVARLPAGAPVPAQIEIDPHRGPLPLADLAVAARAVRRLLAAGRDLDARDLAESGSADVAPGLDLAELDLRARTVQSALAEVSDSLEAALGSARETLLTALLAGIGFELAGLIPTAFDEAALQAHAAAVHRRWATRLAAYQELVTEQEAAWSTLNDLDRYSALTERLALLVGRSFPWGTVCTPTNAADLATSLARNRLGGEAQAMAWLGQVGRADPSARRLRVAVDLTEAVAGGPLARFAVAQFPDLAEPWAARTPPAADRRGRQCLLFTGVPGVVGTERWVGVALGGWSEQVPLRESTAAVAFHYDGASARAPQAVLLATALDDPGWSFDLVQELVFQTLDTATRRMVGPQDLLSVGQFLPMGHLPGDLVTSGGES